MFFFCPTIKSNGQTNSKAISVHNVQQFITNVIQGMYLCMYGPRPMSMRNNNHTTVCWQSYGTWSHKEMRKGRECNDKTKKRKKKKMVCGCLLLVVPFLLCKKRKFYWFCWLLVSSASSSLHLAAGACPLSNLTSFSWECKLFSHIFPLEIYFSFQPCPQV